MGGVRHTLFMDLETYSEAPIAKTGAQRYILDSSFEILLWAYSLDNQPVQIIDLANGEPVPDWLKTALVNPAITKMSYNAPFEFGCLSKYYGQLYPAQWRCTMFHGLYCGYTSGLEATGKALGLPEDKQKLKTGRDLIRYFCVPCRPTKSNGQRTRNYPHHDPDKWQLFKEYCCQDVVTEMEIERRLSSFPVPDFVQKQWETDLRINFRGVAVDMPFVDGALIMGNQVKTEMIEEAEQITNLDNPNSVSQLKDWLNKEIGTGEEEPEIQSLSKDIVKKLLNREDNSPDVQRMLQIRQELGKTSTKKYDAIKMCVCPDKRVRGLLQFYGANRTGRWAGRLVQVQNLPRTYTDPIELARELVTDRKTTAVRCLYGSVSDTLSQLIRTAFVASPGNVLIDADFSAIEARVISWLAGEQWRLEVFRTHGKIYEASASQMFGVPIELIKKGNLEYSLRAKGKVSELALGYQGGVGALINMGALEMGLHEEELPDIVTRWRNSNRNIVNLWYRIQDAAIAAIQDGKTSRVYIKEFDPARAAYNEDITGADPGAYSPYFRTGQDSCLVFKREYDHNQGVYCFTITLPSGRKLFYINPKIGTNRFGGESITYWGMDQTSKKWKEIETYGGKLTENVVQAIARDCLAEAIERLEAAGFPIVFHVHDEVVIDIRPYADNEAMLQQVVDIMKQPPAWAADMPLNAAGWVGDFFTKD